MNIAFYEDNLKSKLLHTAQLNQVLIELLEDEEYSKTDKEHIVESILEREQLMSTYLTDGVMMPRVRMDGGEPSIMIGVTKDNVHFNDLRINIIVLSLYRKDDEKDFVDWLALMSRLFLWRTIRTSIKNSDDENEIKQLIIEGLKTIED